MYFLLNHLQVSGIKIGPFWKDGDATKIAGDVV